MSYSGTKAQAGRGSSLAIGGTPTEIGEVDDVPFDRPEWQFEDATNFDSGSDQEIVPTIRNSTEFTCTGNRVSSDAGQLLVETAYANAGISAFTLTLPKTAAQTTSGDKYTFNAYVLNQSFKIQPKSLIKFSLKLKTSGPVTFTAGS